MENENDRDENAHIHFKTYGLYEKQPLFQNLRSYLVYELNRRCFPALSFEFQICR